MADMEKFYDDLIIINLYESIRRSMVRLHYPDLELKVSKLQKQIFEP